PAADVEEVRVVAGRAQGVQQRDRLGEGLGAGERVVAVQVEVEPLDPHPVRGEVARGGPAPPGLRRFAEAGGADGARGGGGEAQRDRPGAGRGGDVPLRGGAAGGGDLLAGGGGLVEVVEHEGGPGFEGETQQGARLDRGGDHDVARGEPSV